MSGSSCNMTCKQLFRCRQPSWTRLLLVLLSGLLCGLPYRSVRAEAVAEYDLKAAYLYNFSVFIDWPVLPEDTFNLCLLGPDNFGPALKRLESKVVHQRPVSVARLSSLSALRRCQMLFIHEREAPNMRRILAELGDAPVLTVTDSPLVQGTMIALAIEESRLVFDIALNRMRAAGLSPRAKLLPLARNLR